MKVKIKIFICFLALVLCSNVVEAENITAVVQISKDSTAIAGTVAKVANKEVGVTILTTSIDGTNNLYSMSFNNAEYNKLKSEEKKAFMETALGEVTKSSLGNTQKNKIYNFIASQDESVSGAIKYLKSDTSADFVEAKKWFAPFSGPLSTALGFLCILIFSFLALSIVFDIFYLVIPPFRILLERGEENKRPWGVSNEAISSVKEAEDLHNPNKKGIMQLYLSKRIPLFILVSITLGYLVSGKIYDIVVYFMDAFNF